MFSRITLRVVFISMLVTTIASMLTGILVMDRALTVSVGTIANVLLPRVTETVLQCLKDPEHFSNQRAAGFPVWAYDVERGVSANPRAPALDPVLQQRLLAGERAVARFYWMGSVGGAVLFATPLKGPCSSLQVTWGFSDVRRLRMVAGIFLANGISLAFGTMVSLLLAIRPLLKRLKTAASMAEHIGKDEGYQTGLGGTDDAVGRIHREMDRAHLRILAHVAETTAGQQRALQQLHDLAHDLRTPLSSLQLALDELGTLVTGDNHEMKRLLALVLEETSYVNHLTEDLHMLSQLQEGLNPLEREARAELGTLVDRATLRGRIMGRPRTVTVECARPDDAVWVRCNPLALERVVSNLVRNAIVHGREGGNVAISLDLEGPDRFKLRVMDDGPGVRQEELASLTRRGYRGTGARSDSGSGLGLTVVQEICDRVDWRLEFSLLEPSGLCVSLSGACTTPRILERT